MLRPYIQITSQYSKINISSFKNWVSVTETSSFEIGLSLTTTNTKNTGHHEEKKVQHSVTTTSEK